MCGCCSESGNGSRQDSGPSFETPSESPATRWENKVFPRVEQHVSSPVCWRLIAGRAAQRLCCSPEDDCSLVLVTLSHPTAPMNLFCPPVARHEPGQSFWHKVL